MVYIFKSQFPLIVLAINVYGLHAKLPNICSLLLLIVFVIYVCVLEFVVVFNVPLLYGAVCVSLSKYNVNPLMVEL